RSAPSLVPRLRVATPCSRGSAPQTGSHVRQAEPAGQCVPRRSLGTRSSRLNNLTPLHLLREPFGRLARVQGQLPVLGICEAIEVRPEQRQAFVGDDGDRVENAGRIL